MVLAAQDRLVRKEVALGAIREIPPPTDLIGLQLVPFMDVATDDVIFEYIKDDLQDIMAPARAQDAEATLLQSDEFLNGYGRASVVDWSYKNRYSSSDVMNYRDQLRIAEATANLNLMLNTPQSAVAQFNARLARDDARRKRGLDLRLEWLIMTALDTGKIQYNDGKIMWTVDYGRPSDQDGQNPASGIKWDAGTTHDPIGDVLAVQEFMRDRYSIEIEEAIISKKAISKIFRSSRFIVPVTGVVVGGTPSAPIDLNYLNPQFNNEKAVSILEDATGVKFRVYDSVWQTRAIGSTTRVNNRFTNEKSITFLPKMSSLGEIDQTELGFGKMLTSPHAEGNWSPGFYEWEDETRDPWQHVRGSGIKAFPVLPYMQYTYSLDVLA